MYYYLLKYLLKGIDWQPIIMFFVLFGIPIAFIYFASYKIKQANKHFEKAMWYLHEN